LHLAFESAQSVLEGLTLLNSDFRQTLHTPKLVLFGPCSYCKLREASQGVTAAFGRKNASLPAALTLSQNDIRSAS
jgi:hypothetical protein